MESHPSSLNSCALFTEFSDCIISLNVLSTIDFLIIIDSIDSGQVNQLLEATSKPCVIISDLENLQPLNILAYASDLQLYSQPDCSAYSKVLDYVNSNFPDLSVQIC